MMSLSSLLLLLDLDQEVLRVYLVPDRHMGRPDHAGHLGLDRHLHLHGGDHRDNLDQDDEDVCKLTKEEVSPVPPPHARLETPSQRRPLPSSEHQSTTKRFDKRGQIFYRFTCSFLPASAFILLVCDWAADSSRIITVLFWPFSSKLTSRIPSASI